MKHLSFLLVATVLALNTGCKNPQTATSVRLAVNVGVAAAEGFFSQNVSALSDSDLKEHQAIMADLASTLHTLSVHASAYKAAVDTEVAKRGL
jgi:hypothetical protein